MSQHLRHDTTCQNCGFTVDVAYCSNCGKKNIEVRMSFTHLAGHFAEDLTHYDSGFWKTVKYLLFRPARLTLNYLAGHRQSYVPPVKLYIFISFITFFLMSVLPEGNTDIKVKYGEGKQKSSIEIDKGNKLKKGQPLDLNDGRKVKSIKELDSIYALSNGKSINIVEYYTRKATLNASDKDVTSEEIGEEMTHLMPKVLFIYMPIFAFWLWLIHGKKRWYFFDHGIFTLHYFAFLLLTSTIINILGSVISYIFIDTTLITVIYSIILAGYSIFYFFKAHRLMYGETRTISGLKSVVLFIINSVCILITVAVSLIYVLLNIH
jgi:hypothetical protein